MENVVITGMGAVTSIGSTVDEYWDNLVEGKCGIKKVTRISTQEHDTDLVAEVSEEYETLVKKYWTKRQLNSTTAAMRMGLASAGEAVEDSGIDFESEDYDRTRMAVIYGVVSNGLVDNEREKTNNFILRDMPSTLPALISAKYGLHGASFNLSCACATSGYAISLASQLIESGVYDVVITGGLSGIVSHDILFGFNQLFAMSTNPDKDTASRPFTKDRDGFIMGEGAGTLVLESETSAKKRNARIYARLKGHALYSESSNMTAPLAEGEGMRIVMDNAIKNSGLTLNDIEYVNAHGTSTVLNDKYETTAIKNLFGNRAYDIPVSSIKSSIGHTLGAASVLEAIASIKAINTGIIPPTIHYDVPDPELDLDYVPNTARKQQLKTVLSNSFAFGGQNATLIFQKYE